MTPLGVLLVGLQLGAGPAGAGDAGTPVDPPKLETTLSAARVRLGEPLTLRIAVTHAGDQRWELRVPTELGPFEHLSVDRKRQDGSASSLTTFEVRLAVFELGQHVLPGYALDVVDRSGAHPPQPLHGLSVECVGSLPKDVDRSGANLLDIKPNEEVPVRSWRLLWTLLAILGALTFALWLRRHLRSRPPRAPPPTLAVPLHARTRAALERLRREDLPGKGAIRELHFQLSEIVRGYLGERFGFDALECTSGELLREVERRRPPGVDEPGLRAFVDQCDAAKYARASVAAPACRSALDWAERLVDSTPFPPPDATRPVLA